MSEKLSLPAAIFININIMLGAGIFINTLPLAKIAGLLGAGMYALIGIVMLPLVKTIAELARIHPGGSFYTFASKEINTFAGFFSSYAYFTAKLASSALMIHFFSLITQSLIPAFNSVNIFVLDLTILAIFTCLNMLNLRAGMRIQSLFLIMKSFPILFVILSGIFLFTTQNLKAENLIFSGIFSTIPLVIYAFTGFEAATSIGRHIENPDKNAPKVIFLSYGIVILILCAYQFLFYALLGPNLSNAGHYFEAFPFLLKIVFPFNEAVKLKLAAILQLAIASSALGGAYGIIYSNNWNLYALAEHNHLFFSGLFKKFNRFNMPFMCIITEAILCIAYLFITMGNRVQLQQIGVLGSTIAYFISSIALLFVYLKGKPLWLPILAIFNCLILTGFCIWGLINNGILPLFIFTIVLIFGVIMFYINSKKTT